MKLVDKNSFSDLVKQVVELGTSFLMFRCYGGPFIDGVAGRHWTDCILSAALQQLKR